MNDRRPPSRAQARVCTPKRPVVPRSLIALCLGGVLCAAAPGQAAPTRAQTATQDQPPPADESAREAYLRAWMLEHAHGDLDGALAAYQACIDRSGADAELAARARLRMAHIALARGERVVCEALLAEVLERVPDSALAGEARQMLARDPAAAEVPTVQEALSMARRVLGEVLTNPQQTTPGQVQLIFKVLSPEEIHAMCVATRVDVPLGDVYQLSAVREAVLDYVQAYRPSSVDYGLRLFGDFDRDANLPDAVKALAEHEDLVVRRALFGFLTAFRRDQAARDLALRLFRAEPELATAVGDRGQQVRGILEWPEPAGAELLQHLLADLFSQGDWGALTRTLYTADRPRNARGNSYGIPDEQLALVIQTPAGEWLRERFREFPPAQRLELAHDLCQQSRGHSFAFLEADPEPQIRHLALTERLRNGPVQDFPSSIVVTLPESHRFDLLPALSARPTATVNGGGNAGRQTAPPPSTPLPILLECCANDADREQVFRDTLGNANQLDPEPSRRPEAILRRGLADHPGVLLRAWRETNTSSFVERLRMEDPATRDLLTRLVDLALGSPEERDRQGIAWLAARLEHTTDARPFCERGLRDPSPAVRKTWVEQLGLRHASAELQTELLLSPSQGLFESVAGQCEDPAVLRSVLSRLSDARILTIAHHAQLRADRDTLRECFLNLDNPDQRLRLFKQHMVQDFELLLIGLQDPAVAVRSVALRTFEVLDDHLPPSAELPAPENGTMAVRVEYYATHAAEYRTASIRRQVALFEAAILNRGALQQAQLQEFARLLAETLQADRLAELCLSSNGNYVLVGAAGLVQLGDMERMRTCLRESLQPRHLVDASLTLGLVDECIALAQAGRIQPDWLCQQMLVPMGRDDALARIVRLCGQGEFPAYALNGRPGAELGLRACLEEGISDAELSHIVALLPGTEAALDALIEREAWETILRDISRWNLATQNRASILLGQRIGVPSVEGGAPMWPEFVEEQQALIAEWREVLLER